MPEHVHMSVAAHTLLRVAERAGVPRAELLHLAELSESDIPPSPLPMPWTDLSRLTRAAIDATSDPLLPFAAGVDAGIADLGVFGAYQSQCSPYREAKQVLYEQIFPSLSSVMRMRLEEDGDWAQFSAAPTTAMDANDPDVALQIALFLALQSDGPRKIYGTAVPPQHLYLRASKGLDADAIGAMLNCRVALGQSRDCLIVPRVLLDRVLPLAQPWLRDQLRPQFDALLALAAARRVVTITVQAETDRRLTRGDSTDLAAIAEALKMPPRKMRSRLAEEGTTFTDILDTVRKDFTLRQMAHPGVKIAAIGAQVGFSDPAAFTRAFRRWTGVAPMEWRNNLGVHGVLADATGALSIAQGGA